LTPPLVLGFEAAGIVETVGADVTDVSVGDEVAAVLANQGGYAELAIATLWTKKPSEVSWEAAAALPASANAALGVLQELGVKAGERLVILGAAGSVGMIAIQLATNMGVDVIGIARDGNEDLVKSLGATFLSTRRPLVESVQTATDRVDAVFDAAGRGELAAALTLAGRPDRVITLSDASGSSLGVRLSQPTPERAPEALSVTMPMLASGTLTLKPRTVLPMQRASEAHAAMEAPGGHRKIVLTLD
jgi:NADPH:quinone reductase-like Zn-dependent oxidoreductase